MVEVLPSAEAVFPSLPQVEILDCWVTSVSTRVEVAPAMEEVVRIQVGAQLVVVETERPIPLRVQAQLTAAVVVAVPHKVAVLLALAVPVVVVLAELLEQTTMETQQQPTLVVVAAAGQLPALELQTVVPVAAA